MLQNLIYDVGMHTGEDTAYYLHKGYDVVAIEANPMLVEAAQTRFAREVSAGRLRVIGAAIGPNRGTVDFHVNPRHTEWSAAALDVAARDGEPVQTVKVPCIAFADVLAEHGVPYYLKIDIEGYDIYCLEALSKIDLPKYISVESHRLDYLCLLWNLGYRRFKCVDQSDHNRTIEVDNESRAARLSRSFFPVCRAGNHIRALLRRCGAGHVKRALHRGPAASGEPPASALEGRSGWVFPQGASGPFGEETVGTWGDLEAVAYNWLHYRYHRTDRGTLNMEGWFDFHAALP